MIPSYFPFWRQNPRWYFIIAYGQGSLSIVAGIRVIYENVKTNDIRRFIRAKGRKQNHKKELEEISIPTNDEQCKILLEGERGMLL